MENNQMQKPVYKGGWQHRDVILQKLEGPIGEGKVSYPNGDFFKGSFCLSYANIWGQAYLANGKYKFADGRTIEKAYVYFDKTGEFFSLSGFYRVKHPQGPDSLVCIYAGAYYGIELVLAEEPFVREWYAGEMISRESQLQLVRYELDESRGDDFLHLKLYLHNDEGDFELSIRGGHLYTNEYDHAIFEPKIYQSVRMPDGDSYEALYSCTALKAFRPYDGYVVHHDAAAAQYRDERWSQGAMTEAEEWKRDEQAAKNVQLPIPVGEEGVMDALVWADGHISYHRDEWVYDGEVQNDRPHGKGVLVGDRYHGNRRYEGQFCDGRWVEEKPFEGKIQLHIRYGSKHWSISNSGEWEHKEEVRVAHLGKLNIPGFYSYEITKIEADRITICFYDETYYVTPEEPLNLYNEVEGREWSDGCVYDGDDYTLRIDWI